MMHVISIKAPHLDRAVTSGQRDSVQARPRGCNEVDFVRRHRVSKNLFEPVVLLMHRFSLELHSRGNNLKMDFS